MATKKKMLKTASEATSDINKKKKSFFSGALRSMSKTHFIILAIVITGGIALFTSIGVIAHNSSLRASSAEYEHLRLLRESGAEYDYLTGLSVGNSEAGAAQQSAVEIEMLAINPDFVCWIRIDGTGIDYPVVRGTDNEKYLNTSFSGESNKAGTLFMDYRIVEESMPHIIIYGHNLQEGGMFADLRKFLDAQFMQDNNIITLTVNGHDVRFAVFAARISDINDSAYFLDFSHRRGFMRFADRINAPLHATQILTLSTCTSGGSDDARMIVQAYRLFD